MAILPTFHPLSETDGFFPSGKRTLWNEDVRPVARASRAATSDSDAARGVAVLLRVVVGAAALAISLFPKKKALAISHVTLRAAASGVRTAHFVGPLDPTAPRHALFTLQLLYKGARGPGHHPPDPRSPNSASPSITYYSHGSPAPAPAAAARVGLQLPLRLRRLLIIPWFNYCSHVVGMRRLR